MNIEDPKAEPTTIFGTLKPADPFRYNNDIWIRTQHGPEDSYNAVNLKTGEVGRLYDTVQVVPVNVKLVVGGK